LNWFIKYNFCFLAVAANVIRESILDYKEGDRYFYFPSDRDGQLHLVDAQEPIDDEFIFEYTKDPTNNRYFLYTR
jgi:hypothetical protein